GYELETNSELIRTLESQIRIWNSSKSIRLASEFLRGQAVGELAKPQYPEEPHDQELKLFAKFLRNSLGGKTDPRAGAATPGLSDHGQLHAVDFVVRKNGQMV